nr:anaphase-promoting complex subunit 8 [Ipomoea batatas]
MGSKENYRNELRTAIRQLNDHCLYSAAKWWEREEERGVEAEARENSGEFSDQVSRSTVQVCGFLTGVLLSIFLSRECSRVPYSLSGNSESS